MHDNIVHPGNKVNVKIDSVTVYGARHALETLSQLTVPVKNPRSSHALAIIDYAMIQDKPIYAHRGLLIDIARNFLPLYNVLSVIDGLASAKMNVLHFHATDSQSFPLEIKSVPLMSL